MPSTVEARPGEARNEAEQAPSERSIELAREIQEHKREIRKLTDRIVESSERVGKLKVSIGKEHIKNAIDRESREIAAEIQRITQEVEDVFGGDGLPPDILSAKTRMEQANESLAQIKQKTEEEYNRIINTPEVRKFIGEYKERKTFKRLPTFLQNILKKGPDALRYRWNSAEEKKQEKAEKQLEGADLPKNVKEATLKGEDHAKHLHDVLVALELQPEDKRADYLRTYLREEAQEIPEAYMKKVESIVSARGDFVERQLWTSGTSLLDNPEDLTTFQEQEQQIKRLRRQQSELRGSGVLAAERMTQLREIRDRMTFALDDQEELVKNQERTYENERRGLKEQLADATRAGQRTEKIQARLNQLTSLLQKLLDQRSVIQQERQFLKLQDAHDNERLYEGAIKRLEAAYQLRGRLTDEPTKQLLDGFANRMVSVARDNDIGRLAVMNHSLFELIGTINRLQEAQSSSDLEEVGNMNRKIRDLVNTAGIVEEIPLNELNERGVNDPELLQEQVSEQLRNILGEGLHNRSLLTPEARSLVTDIENLRNRFPLIESVPERQRDFDRLKQKLEELRTHPALLRNTTPEAAPAEAEEAPAAEAEAAEAAPEGEPTAPEVGTAAETPEAAAEGAIEASAAEAPTEGGPEDQVDEIMSAGNYFLDQVPDSPEYAAERKAMADLLQPGILDLTEKTDRQMLLDAATRLEKASEKDLSGAISRHLALADLADALELPAEREGASEEPATSAAAPEQAPATSPTAEPAAGTETKAEENEEQGLRERAQKLKTLPLKADRDAISKQMKALTKLGAFRKAALDSKQISEIQKLIDSAERRLAENERLRESIRPFIEKYQAEPLSTSKSGKVLQARERLNKANVDLLSGSSVTGDKKAGFIKAAQNLLDVASGPVDGVKADYEGLQSTLDAVSERLLGKKQEPAVEPIKTREPEGAPPQPVDAPGTPDTEQPAAVPAEQEAPPTETLPSVVEQIKTVLQTSEFSLPKQVLDNVNVGLEALGQLNNAQRRELFESILKGALSLNQDAELTKIPESSLPTKTVDSLKRLQRLLHASKEGGYFES